LKVITLARSPLIPKMTKASAGRWPLAAGLRVVFLLRLVFVATVGFVLGPPCQTNPIVSRLGPRRITPFG
jgi:hypothetical protein